MLDRTCQIFPPELKILQSAPTSSLQLPSIKGRSTVFHPFAFTFIFVKVVFVAPLSDVTCSIPPKVGLIILDHQIRFSGNIHSNMPRRVVHPDQRHLENL